MNKQGPNGISWTDVPGYPGYKVTRQGQIRGPKKILRPMESESGHLHVIAYLDRDLRIISRYGSKLPAIELKDILPRPAIDIHIEKRIGFEIQRRNISSDGDLQPIQADAKHCLPAIELVIGKSPAQFDRSGFRKKRLTVNHQF